MKGLTDGTDLMCTEPMNEHDLEINDAHNVHYCERNTIKSLQNTIHKTSIEHGWWEPQELSNTFRLRSNELFKSGELVFAQRTFGDLVAFVHSELSEALEAYRDHGLDKWETWPDNENLPNWSGGDSESAKRYLIEHATKAKELGVVPKPEGAFVELADAIIRILDMSEFYGVDMQALILEKMNYNENRSFADG